MIQFIQVPVSNYTKSEIGLIFGWTRETLKRRLKTVPFLHTQEFASRQELTTREVEAIFSKFGQPELPLNHPVLKRRLVS